MLQPTAVSQTNQLASSGSNPVINAPVVSDRVKLEKLQHIPSVKSNLMSQENNSQTDLNAKPGFSNGPSFDYENMPIGKKTMLAPLSNVSPVISGGKEQQIAHMQNDVANRKNNR